MKLNILITGAEGFLGKNLSAALINIKEGRDKTHPELDIGDIFLYDVNSSESELHEACRKADFVFHFAGVNRPADPAEYMRVNHGFTLSLMGLLKKYNNACPVVFSSSKHVSTAGKDITEYVQSKKAAEEALLKYAEETGARVMIYRLPNVFGKWCQPDYNSVVATFCSNIANGLPVRIDDPLKKLELLYIDDLADEMLCALSGREHRCDAEPFCRAPITHTAALGDMVSMLKDFQKISETLEIPQMPANSFAKKLCTTYLSYLPESKIAFSLKTNGDERGSLTELLKTEECGQISVSITKAGVTRGEHWHNTKWEIFFVVSGHGLVRMRRHDVDEIFDFEVSGDKPCAVRMLPGYVHNIINLSETEDLVTVMWANERFDSENPDTFSETVEKGK